MSKAVFLNGSPKRSKAVSEKYLALMNEGFSEDVSVQEIYLYGTDFADKEFETIKSADSVIMALPLYVDSVPARVIEFMKAYCHADTEAEGNGPEFYFIINCGFMEHEQNDTAIKILKAFAEKAGFSFGGGISIGSGAMILGTEDAEEVKLLLRKLGEKAERKEKLADIMKINVNMPKEQFREVFNKVWIDVAAKKGLEEEDLRRRFY